jgi:hypothetical protein
MTDSSPGRSTATNTASWSHEYSWLIQEWNTAILVQPAIAMGSASPARSELQLFLVHPAVVMVRAGLHRSAVQLSLLQPGVMYVQLSLVQPTMAAGRTGAAGN